MTPDVGVHRSRESSPSTTQSECPALDLNIIKLSDLGFWYFKALSDNISIRRNVLFPDALSGRREPSPLGQSGFLSSQAINSKWEQVNH